jgi:5-formaminoimidazole-4-carboxamide-1-(beta)-D-ribofuranosyl 5'-monophosphate synthetase
MISKEIIDQILNKYNKEDITIGVLGGHSALDVCRGAKKYGFRTVVVCARDRASTYQKYFRCRNRSGQDIGCIDEIILVNKFSEIIEPSIQAKLKAMNTIFIHSRYFWVYFNDFNQIENEFKVPVFGTRQLVKLEERDVEFNQYYLLEKSGIPIPRIYNDPKEIDRLVLVKVNEAERGYERAFFFAHDNDTYISKSTEMIKSGMITEQALKTAVIEEYIVGAQVNCNFFYSPLHNELELMGTDTRRQTNLDGLLRLPADQQLEVLKYLQPTMVETGHITVTTKESLLEKMFDIGEKFVKTLAEEKHCRPGMIGPFALQGAIASRKGREEIVIFDVSMRIPGSPGTIFTPYTGYLYGDSISYGERIAMEIKTAIKENKLQLICT